MKLTDAFSKVIRGLGIKHVFGLQGGAVVHFFDSLERSNVGVTYNHHEESAALAATAYAKITQNIGCVIVTTGPGSTNAITGLMAAWQDSVACIFISGQARSNHVSYGKKVRQVGTQEVNICDIVKPLTKYTKFIKKKENFLPELYKATKISLTGRPGPVWLDVPLEIQWSDIKFDKKYIYKKKIDKLKINNSRNFKKAFDLLNFAKRPLLVLGSGIKGQDGENSIKKLVKKFNIPFVTTWGTADIFETDHINNLGIIGMSGQRGANKSIFSSDLIVCLGTHLAIPHTTTLFKNYAPNAKKIIINIDKNELKNTNVKFDLKIEDNAINFINWLIKKKNYFNFSWQSKKFLKDMNWYDPAENSKPNSNKFVRFLTNSISEKKCIIADGGGTALYAAFQSSKIRKNDRLVCSSSISSMGTGLAETIGVTKSNKFKKYLCIIGDGSFLMNVQDLQNIAQDGKNVVIILVNNNGYLAIRHTQKEFLGGRYFGTHPKYNLSFPNFKKIAKAFSIKYIKADKAKNVEKIIKILKSTKGPIICEIVTDEDQQSLFKQGYKQVSKGILEPQPLSEMFPFVDKPIANTNN